MKKSLIAFFFLLQFTGCGSKDKDQNPPPGESACNLKAQQTLDKMLLSCSSNLEVQQNKEDCLSSAESFKTDYSALGCQIYDGKNKITLTADFVQATFIDPLKKEPEDDILNSGLFDD